MIITYQKGTKFRSVGNPNIIEGLSLDIVMIASLIVEIDYEDDTYTIKKDRWGEESESVWPLDNLPAFLHMRTIQQIKASEDFIYYDYTP